MIGGFDKNTGDTVHGASLELSPPLLYSYEVEGVTVPVTHPVA